MIKLLQTKHGDDAVHAAAYTDKQVARLVEAQLSADGLAVHRVQRLIRAEGFEAKVYVVIARVAAVEVSRVEYIPVPNCESGEVER